MSKEETQKIVHVMLGAGAMFLLLLAIGLLDANGMLDPILDALHIP